MSDFKLPKASDYFATLRHLIPMTHAAAGWDTKVLEPDVCAGPLAYFYTMDTPTRALWMGAVNASAIADIRRRAASIPQEIICSAVGAFVVAQAKGRLLDGVSEEEFPRLFGMSVATYATTTKVFASHDLSIRGGHFVVVNYRKPSSVDGLLRPFVIPSNDNSPLSTDQVLDAVALVERGDRARHPEWFDFH